jgi:hypothetical protein
MLKHSWSSVLLALAACGGGKPSTEHYAVGTYLFTGSIMTGSTDCKFDAPPGVLDGSKILAPGVIKESCPSGVTATINAEFADHVAITFPKTAKVGDRLYFEFQLRNAKDERLTPTLSEMGDTKLADGCTAIRDLGRGGAQDTGHDPFMSAQAAAPGTCKVSIDIELPSASGMKNLHAEQDVTITN